VYLHNSQVHYIWILSAFGIFGDYENYTFLESFLESNQKNNVIAPSPIWPPFYKMAALKQ